MNSRQNNRDSRPENACSTAPVPKKICLEIKKCNGLQIRPSLQIKCSQPVEPLSAIELPPVEPVTEHNSTSQNLAAQTWFTSKDEKLAHLNNGEQWKQGQWTKEEVEHLTRNVLNYCQERGVDDPSHIIFNMSRDERKDFYKIVAVGLERPLFAVYRRIIRMYDRKNYVGRYTQEDLAKLKQLRLEHGSNWAVIGSQLGRSAASVKDRWRLMKETCKGGKWGEDEEERLRRAIVMLSRESEGAGVVDGISWKEVSDVVGTRSEKQCRTKWLNELSWRERGESGGGDWTRHDDLMLLDRLSNCCVTNETDLDWNSISDNWKSPRSPQWLRSKWSSLKRLVPERDSLVFAELLNRVRGSFRSSASCVLIPVAETDREENDNTSFDRQSSTYENSSLIYPPQYHSVVEVLQTSNQSNHTSGEALDTITDSGHTVESYCSPGSAGLYIVTSTDQYPVYEGCSAASPDQVRPVCYEESKTVGSDQIRPVLASSDQYKSVYYEGCSEDGFVVADEDGQVDLSNVVLLQLVDYNSPEVVSESIEVEEVHNEVVTRSEEVLPSESTIVSDASYFISDHTVTDFCSTQDNIAPCVVAQTDVVVVAEDVVCSDFSSTLDDGNVEPDLVSLPISSADLVSLSNQYSQSISSNIHVLINKTDPILVSQSTED